MLVQIIRMVQPHNDFERRIPRLRGLFFVLVAIASFALMATPANASIILADESCSVEWFNAGVFDLGPFASEFYLPSTRSVPCSEAPSPWLPSVRLSGKTAISVSSIGSMGYPASYASSGGLAVAVLPDGPFILPSSLGLNWLSSERSLDVPLAPTFELLRPPQGSSLS